RPAHEARRRPHRPRRADRHEQIAVAQPLLRRPLRLRRDQLAEQHHRRPHQHPAAQRRGAPRPPPPPPPHPPPPAPPAPPRPPAPPPAAPPPSSPRSPLRVTNKTPAAPAPPAPTPPSVRCAAVGAALAIACRNRQNVEHASPRCVTSAATSDSFATSGSLHS